MLRNNRNSKGSVLIVSILVFSIISTISIVSISWIFTNSKIFSLEYKDNLLKEGSLSGSEIAKSNILRNIRKAIDTTSNESGFNEYFLGNNMESFIDDIKNISSSGLDNVTVKVRDNRVTEENGYLAFGIVSTSKDGNYYKTVNVDVAIKNPYRLEDDTINLEPDNSEVSQTENYVKQENNSRENDTKENNDFDECDFLRFYNYRGL
jgi:hypothetical protein